MTWFEKAFGEWIVKNRWWVILTAITVLAISASGLRFLTINNDTRVFFSEENPQLKALEALENTYNKNDNILFIAAPKNGNVFTQETLSAVEALTEASWQIPYSSRVDSVTNFQYARAEEDDLIVEDLVINAEGMSDGEIRNIRKIALAEPMLVKRLVSATGHVTGVNITVLAPGKHLNEVTEVTNFARGIADDFRRAHPDIELYLSGGVAFDNAFGEASQKDMTTLIPAMFITLIIVIGILLRSFFGTLSTLMIILFSMFTGMGLAGWLGISITPASVNAPTLILTLAVADSIHILATMFNQMRLGMSKFEAISESLRVNLVPVFITSVTTAIGFLTMNFSDAPPFRDLGNIVAMGVMAAFFYSVTFLPALLAVLPVRTRAKKENTDPAGCEHIANFVIKRRRPIFIGTLVVIMFLSTGLTRIDLNDDFVKYFDRSFDIRVSTDFMIENLGGFDTIEYSMESGETGGINEPGYLSKLEEFANWYRKFPEVVHVSVISETMKRLNKNMHGDDEAYYRIPEERELAAQYLLMYEMSLPFGLDLNNQINVDKSSTRMTVTLKDMTASRIIEMDRMARDWLKTNAPKSMFTYGSGLSVMWAHITERNIRSMLIASFWALVLISGILMLALRSFRLGLVSLIPNLAPAFMAFGIWGMTRVEVGLGLSVLVSMTIGIVVDDTVHFMSKYLRGRRELGMEPPDAVRYSFNTVGTAMWVTTVSLVAGFLVLTLSGYKMNFDMGLMSAITITLALILDFLFLPVLLMKVDRGDGKTALT